MGVSLDLENPENWQPRDSQSLTAAPESPLPDFLSETTFTSKVIAIIIDNPEKDTWRFAGYLSQKINLPFGPSSLKSNLQPRRLWLRQKQVLIFPEVLPAYKVGIVFPRWFNQASVTLWEYRQQNPS